MPEVFQQIILAFIFYIAVVGVFRIAGKRFAGQTTTFDLVVLISLGVAIQQATLLKGAHNATLFVVTVFLSHLGLAKACARYPRVRDIARGRPCRLIEDGKVNENSMKREGLTVDELRAGLRKLGIDEISQVKTAHLEETGQISAVRRSGYEPSI